MTQEQAFENFVASQLSLYTLNQGVSLYDAAKLSWQASSESLKQKLLSDEMVKRAAEAFASADSDCVGSEDWKLYKQQMEAALQAVVEGL